jgi:hypothetical protein
MSRTDFERMIAHKSLEFVSNCRNEYLSEMLIQSGNADKLMKNLCTKVTVQLSDKIDNLCNMLGISKRAFCEGAFIEAVEKAESIMREEGVFAVLDDHLPDDAKEAILDHIAEERAKREEAESILEDLERDQALEEYHP